MGQIHVHQLGCCINECGGDYPAGVLFYILKTLARSGGNPFGSTETLAYMSGVHIRTVRRKLSKLAEIGLIEVVRRDKIPEYRLLDRGQAVPTSGQAVPENGQAVPDTLYKGNKSKESPGDPGGGEDQMKVEDIIGSQQDSDEPKMPEQFIGARVTEFIQKWNRYKHVGEVRPPMDTRRRGNVNRLVNFIKEEVQSVPFKYSIAYKDLERFRIRYLCLIVTRWEMFCEYVLSQDPEAKLPVIANPDYMYKHRYLIVPFIDEIFKETYG